MAAPGAQVLALPTLRGAGAVVVATLRRHPVRTTVALSSYLIGLGVALFFSGLAVTADQYKVFELARPSQEATETLYAAQRVASDDLHAYQAAKGWFWSCDEYCQGRRSRYERSKAKAVALQSDYDTQMRIANSHLGIFSTVGVAKARELFYSLYGWGKGMAGRMTFYDVIFSGFRMSRDDTFVDWAVRMVWQVLVNLFISTCAVVVSFATGVMSVIHSFGPSIPEAIAFYVLAMLAVLATTLTACCCCCGVVVGVPAAIIASAPPGAFRPPRRIDAGGNLHGGGRAYGGGGGGGGGGGAPGFGARQH